MTLRFTDYYQKRQRVDEVLDWFKQKAQQAQQAVGKGRTSLDKFSAAKAAQEAPGVATAGSEIAGGVASLAGNVATGNVVGAAFSVWNLIKSISSAAGGLRNMGQAGTLAIQCQTWKADLRKYLTDTVNVHDDSANKIVDAVFEIDGDSAIQIPAALWGPITADFASKLRAGYHDIERKAFPLVVAEHLHRWYTEKFGSHADTAASRIKELLNDLRTQAGEAQQVLAHPQVQQVVQQYQPGDPQKAVGDSVSAASPKEFGLTSNVRSLKVGDKVVVQTMGNMHHGSITGVEPGRGFRVEMDEDGREFVVSSAYSGGFQKGKEHRRPFAIFRRFKPGDRVVNPDSARGVPERGVVIADNRGGLYVRWAHSKKDDQVMAASYDYAIPEEEYEAGFSGE